MGLDQYFEARHKLSSKRKKEKELIDMLNKHPFTDEQKKTLFGEDEDERGVYVSEWSAPELHELLKDVKLYGQEGKIKLLYASTAKNGKTIWTVETESYYWRKSNQIHKWFVDNVQAGVDDCGDYQVSYQHLQDFVEVLEKVSKDHSLAATLLPSQSGFFFGGTEYDEWYFDDIKRTLKAFKSMLNKRSFINNWTPFYHSSW